MANPPNIPFSQLNPAQVQGLGPFPTKNQLLFPQPGAVMILPANQGNGTAGYVRTRNMGIGSTKDFTIALWVYCPRSTFRDYGLIQSIFEFGLPQGAQELSSDSFYLNKTNDAFDENAFGGTVQVFHDPNDVLPTGTPEWVWFNGTYYHFEAIKVDNPYNKVCSLVAAASSNFADGELYAEFHDSEGVLLQKEDALNSSADNTIKFVSDHWTFVGLSARSPNANFPYANQEFSLPCLSVNLNSTSQPQGPIAYAQLQMWSTFLLDFTDRATNDSFVVTDPSTGQWHPASPFTEVQLNPNFNPRVRQLLLTGQSYLYPPAQTEFGGSDILLDGYANEITPIANTLRPAFWQNLGPAGPFEFNNIVPFFPGP